MRGFLRSVFGPPAIVLVWFVLCGPLLVRRFDRNTGGRDFDGHEVPPATPSGPRSPVFRRATDTDGPPVVGEDESLAARIRRPIEERRAAWQTLAEEDAARARAIRRDAAVTVGLLATAALIGVGLTAFVIGVPAASPTAPAVAAVPSPSETPTGDAAGATASAAPSPTAAPTASPSPTPSPVPTLGEPEVRVELADTSRAGVPNLAVSWNDVPGASGYQLAFRAGDGEWERVELPSSDSTEATIGVVPDRAYRFRVRATGEDDAGGWRTTEPLRLSLVEEDASSVRYEGSWEEARHASYAGGDVHFSGITRASVTITFDGLGIAWRGPTGPERGHGEVHVDGESAGRIDTGGNVFQPVNVLFARSFDEPGEHELEIEVEGTSGRPLVAVDAFYVLEPAD